MLVCTKNHKSLVNVKFHGLAHSSVRILCSILAAWLYYYFVSMRHLGGTDRGTDIRPEQVLTGVGAMLGRVFLSLCVVMVTGLAGDFAADTVGNESSFTVTGACCTSLLGAVLVVGWDDSLLGAETTLAVVSEYFSLFGCGSCGWIKTRFRRNDLPVPSHSSVYERGSGPWPVIVAGDHVFRATSW